MLFTKDDKAFIKIFVPDYRLYYMDYENLWESTDNGWKRSGLDNVITKTTRKFSKADKTRATLAKRNVK